MNSKNRTNKKTNFWIQFLKIKRKTILLYFATVLLFLITGSLYHVENLGKLLYAALLTFALWLIAGISQGLKFVRCCKGLEAAARHFEESGELLLGESCRPEELMEACGTTEQLTRLLLSVNDARQRDLDSWEEKTTDRKDYYMMWTHQIKTPISALRLLLEKNSDGRDSFLMREELFKIEQYVEMVLTFQRLDSMASDLVLQEYELTSMLRQSVRKYSVLFINKGLSVEVPDRETKVLTDEKWFTFCLEQLLSNSIKYTQDGGIRFLIEDGERSVRLTVADTGIGIRSEDLPRIFERGFTGYNGRLDKKSTGIGLYLCKQVFDRLGIAIRAESEIGSGTRMILTLPKPYKNVSLEKEM